MSATSAPAGLSTHEPVTPRLSEPGRLGPEWANRVKALLGLPWQRRLAQAALQVPKVRHFEAEYTKLSDADLKATSLRLRGRARSPDEKIDRLIPEAYGLACVAAWRVLGLKPFDVQITAGTVLQGGALAEVATGEGKTLIAAFPTVLNALTGKGVHVTTTNDYLARRDAEWLEPVYKALGLTVGILQQQMGEQDRRRAYRQDITYGTASEFGFDFLRDRLKVAGNRGQESPFWAPFMPGFQSQAAAADPLVQRAEHYFALVDEADNIFIDEARTPLIIASPTRSATVEESVAYHWADRVAKTMKQNEHFTMDEKKGKIELTLVGRETVRWSNPPTGQHSHAMDKLVEHVERSLQAHYRMHLDQHYMVEKGKIVIIDEFTGRRMPDRHWREGLHQAVEAKENQQITMASDHAASVTFQSYFRLYKRLAGMTGTAAQNWWEIYKVYNLWVVCVPTNRAVIREQWPDRVFPTEEAKFDAIVAEVQRLRALNRPVLIGTRSVDHSERLSKKLTAVGIPHQVLNAKQHDQEAKVVAEAGQVGHVTIATNMAGRGTDIKPSPDVLSAGGLHVLGTERHESLRIDRQLIGRSGRQGDRGSCQFFLSLDDELLEGLGEDWQDHLKELGRTGDPSTNWQNYHSLFIKAQKRTESKHYRNRVDLMIYEKRRQEILKDLSADPYVD